MSIRRPVWVLHVLVVGLAVHNLVMSQLWRAGIRGAALSTLAAWKDVLLAAALVVVFVGLRGRRFRPTVCDWLALAFAGFVIVYGLIPQSVLGGAATHSGVVYAARHDLLPVEAYLLGRGLALTVAEQRALIRTVLWTAAGVALFGLLDVYLVPLSFWREAAGWYEQQLGLTAHGNGLSGLPENFVYNAGNNVVFRRLTSTFLSPLATGYLLVVALLAVSLRRRSAVLLPMLLFAALLWTHTRAGLAALVVGLVVLAVLRRSYASAGLAVLVVVVGFVFIEAYPHFAPRTHFTTSELRIQEHHAQANPGTSHDATSANESSTHEHLQSLREGVRTVLHHPFGFGLGNAGVTAERTKVTVEAGESTYTELAAETGLVGGLLFLGWSLVLLVRLFAEPPLAAAFAAVLFIGLQTDVIGIPWLAVAVWALAGSAAYRRTVSRAKPARLVTTSPILG